MEQRRKTSSFEVGNDLFWMGRTEKGTRRHVNASVAFKRTPTLRLSFVNDGQGYGQTAQSSTLSMNVSSSFNIPIGKVLRLRLPVTLSATYDDVETERCCEFEIRNSGVGDFKSPPTNVNHIKGWSLTPSANPGFEIYSRNRRFYLSAGLGAALKGLYYNRLYYTKPVLNPSASINYTFSANSKLQFSTGYTTQIGDMMTLLTEPVQVNYRTVRTSSGIIGESNTWYTSGDWKWQLPMQYFTLGIAAGHTEDRRNTLYSQSVSGIDVSNSALQRDTRSRSTHFSVSSTKNIPSIFTKFGAEGSYSFGSGEQAVNGNVIKMRNSSYSIHGNASVTPVAWLALDLKVAWLVQEVRCDIRYNWSKASQTSSSLSGLADAYSLHVFPVAALDLSLDYSHVRRQLAADQHKHMSLFDASAQYKWKRCVLRLELSNLLNQRSYSYTLNDGINTYSYDYGLCGRTVLLRATFSM